MKLLIDYADLNEIRRLTELYPIDGVTTNPSILADTKEDPCKRLKEIRELIGDDAMLFAQALGDTAEEMIRDAHTLVGLTGKGTIVKIPSVPEGFKAMRELKKEGIATCGTVVYSPMQAYLAAKSGASYAAPYVNRIDNLGYNGIGVVKSIQDIFDNNNMECQVLAASFKNAQQVLELCEYGIGASTAVPDVIDALAKNPSVDNAIAVFASDFLNLTGKKTMTDIS